MAGNRDFGQIGHELRQPLNVIAMVTANIRNVVLSDINGDLANYLAKKLDRIDGQIDRMNIILQGYGESV